MQKRVSSITVPNDPRYTEAVVSYCRELAARIGFPEKEVSEIASSLEEACTNVITHAFDPYEEESFTITFEILPDGLRIVVDEMGVPFSMGEVKRSKKTPGIDAMEKNMDRVVFINRGREGKELQLTKYLKGRHVEELFAPEELRPYETCEIPSREEGFEVRLMKTEEAVEVSRCIYRAYRYTYLKEDLYFPERVESMNRDGRMVSAVSLNREGVVTGHFALLPRPNGKVAEIGVAVVVPMYRGRGIMKTLLEFLIEEAGKRGFIALYGNAFTMHALSQKTNLKFGFSETALQLGCFPPGSVKILKDKGLRSAGSVMTFFKYLGKAESYPVFLPPRHEKMLLEIYRGLGVERSFEAPRAPATEPSAEESSIELTVKPAHRTAVVIVKSCGKDIEARVRGKLSELEKRGANATYLDLSLRDPATPWAVTVLETLGFFFSGLLPDYSEGDVLRLQHISAPIDYDEIEAHSPFASRIKEYVKSLDPRWTALHPGALMPPPVQGPGLKNGI